MVSNRINLFLSGVFLSLILMRPNVPVLAGVGLLTLVITGARRDLCSSSPRKRWAAFKRLVLLSITGGMLVLVGVGIESAPWQMSVSTAAQARHAMAALVIYNAALIGAPALAWAHLSLREPGAKRKIAKKATATTLENIGCAERIHRVQIAV